MGDWLSMSSNFLYTGKSSWINGSQFAIVWVSARGETETYASPVLQSVLSPSVGQVGLFGPDVLEKIKKICSKSPNPSGLLSKKRKSLSKVTSDEVSQPSIRPGNNTNVRDVVDQESTEILPGMFTSLSLSLSWDRFKKKKTPRLGAQSSSRHPTHHLQKQPRYVVIWTAFQSFKTWTPQPLPYPPLLLPPHHPHWTIDTQLRERWTVVSIKTSLDHLRITPTPRNLEPQSRSISQMHLPIRSWLSILAVPLILYSLALPSGSVRCLPNLQTRRQRSSPKLCQSLRAREEVLDQGR